jgi:hypothetical protein
MKPGQLLPMSPGDFIPNRVGRNPITVDGAAAGGLVETAARGG